MSSIADRIGKGTATGVGMLPFSMLSHLAGGLFSALTTPHVTGFAQDQWSGKPILLPDPGAIYNAYMRGFLPEDIADLACAMQGVDFQPDIPLLIPGKLWPRAWWGVMRSHLALPSPDTAMAGFVAGLYDTAEVQAMLRRSGANIERYMNHPELWQDVPGPDAILRMVRMGLIDEATARKWLIRAGCDPDRYINTLDAGTSYPGVNEALRGFIRGRVPEAFARYCVQRHGGKWEDWAQLLPALEEMPLPQMALQALARDRVTQDYAEAIVTSSGGDWQTWSALLPSMYTQLGNADILEARNRGLITDNQRDDMLRLNGVQDTTARILLNRLRERMPSPFEAVQMGTRGAFSPDIGSLLGLYDGQPPAMQVWLGRLGLHAEAGVEIVADGVTRQATMADMYWASARRGMSLEQAIGAYRRLRPEVIEEVRRFVPDVVEFDRNQVRGWMTFNGIPESIQPALEELGYLPLSLREIRTVVRLGTRPKEWVIARLQDQGHRRDRAEDLYDILADQERWRQEAPLRAVQNSLLRNVTNEVLDQYSVGTMDKRTVRDYLINVRINSEVVDQMLNVIDARLASKIASEGIRAVRKDYLNGTLNAEEVVQQLAAMGIVDQRIRDYVALWTIQRNRVRRTATTAQILGWVAQGILDAPTAAIRLANLGWDRPDILTQIGVAQGKLLQQEARAVSAEDKRRLARAKELSRVQKENERMQRQLQSDQRRATPRSVLDKWLCSGAISEGFYLARMQAMGFTAAQSQEYLNVAIAKKACQPAPEGTPFPAVPPHEGNGDAKP